jgi:Ala-tRNA(Pro) deacylase
MIRLTSVPGFRPHVLTEGCRCGLARSRWENLPHSRTRQLTDLEEPRQLQTRHEGKEIAQQLMRGGHMAVASSVQEFLRCANVAYAVFPHPTNASVPDTSVSGVPRRQWAKAISCFRDGEPIQAVVQADRKVDLARLAFLGGMTNVRLASDAELRWLYPDCERGAVPPLGPLYRQRVFVDRALAFTQEIAFNGGTYRDAVVMRYADFAAIAHPMVGFIARY